MLEDWVQIKRSASDAVHKYGGTITHHHAIGETIQIGIRSKDQMILEKYFIMLKNI